MDSRADFLLQQGDNLFSKRQRLDTLWQEIGENFYPERAEFTLRRQPGDDFASHLTTSMPLLARRDLAGSISSMLRPTNKEWFHVGTKRPDRETSEDKRWLEWATSVQRRATYDPDAQFSKATTEGDHDWSTFGQCVIGIDTNRRKRHLSYRGYHLKDVVWAEDVNTSIDRIHRKWRPTAYQLSQIPTFSLAPKVQKMLEKDPFAEIECRHIIMPTEAYLGIKKFNTPYVSIYVDRDNAHIMEEVGVWTKKYAIPRWQTLSGSQYAYSPATIIALPDARLIQAMTLVLLEAGEKAVNPPMIATQDAIRSDIAIFPGGVTWVDSAYDEKLGEVLRPLNQDHSGIPMGFEMREQIVQTIKEAFYLNKLSLPPNSGNPATAYEISMRVQEYIREALPLFGPMEPEYNGQVCDLTFEELLHNGAFGSFQDMPQNLRGADIQFVFESPLHDAIEQVKGQKFLETKSMLAEAAALDQGAVAMLDVRTALRDVLDGIGTPAAWVRDPEEMEAIDQQRQQQEQSAQLLETMQQGASVAETIGRAKESLIQTQ